MDEKMRGNLFTYATRELSQDAFLRWLFENWQDNEIRPVVYALLKEFCEFTADEQITNITTWAQWRKIDISVFIKTSKRRDIGLFIEDKVGSKEHNQLQDYNKTFEVTDRKGKPNYKVFYKTTPIDDEEHKRVTDAKWNIYDIEQIYRLFEPYLKTNNVILHQYIEYIKCLYEATLNAARPLSNDGIIDYLAWTSYFNKIIKSHFVDKFDCEVHQAGIYPYVCLILRMKGRHDVPYFEVRSRDCLNNNLIVRILSYGVENMTPLSVIVNKVNEDKVMDAKGIRKNEPKSICKKSFDNVYTDCQIVEKIKIYADYYFNLMTLWISELEKE